jgi:hypothetical protein
MSPQHSSAGIPECRANVRRTVFAMPAPNYPAPAPPRQHASRAKPGFPADIHKQLRSPDRSQSAGRRPRRRSDGGSVFPQAVRQRLGRKRKWGSGVNWVRKTAPSIPLKYLTRRRGPR